MKRFVIGILALAFAAGAASGQTADFDPLRFLPPATRSSEAADWLAAYSHELLRLSEGAVITKAALLSAEGYCRSAAFPEDPLLAARLVRVAIAEADLRLRRGDPAAAIKAAVSVEWTAGLRGSAARAGRDNPQGAEKKLKRDLSIAGGREQSLPGNRDHANKKINEKIKEKKNK